MILRKGLTSLKFVCFFLYKYEWRVREGVLSAIMRRGYAKQKVESWVMNDIVDFN